MRGQKGITLIALIITIIVMLILVVTAVSVAVNSGLFDKAGEAATGWNENQAAEMNLHEGVSTNVNGNTVTGIDNIVNSYTNTPAEEVAP